MSKTYDPYKLALIPTNYKDGEKFHLLVASWLKKIWSSIATSLTLTFEIIKPEQKNNNNSNCEDGEMFQLLGANWLKEIWSSVTAMTSEVGDNVNQNKKIKIKKLSYNNHDRHTYKRLIDYNLERTTLQNGRVKFFVD